MARKLVHKRFIIEEDRYQTDGLWILRIIVTDKKTGETKTVAGSRPWFFFSEEEARKNFVRLARWWLEVGCWLS